jgi:hypothetical protein
MFQPAMAVDTLLGACKPIIQFEYFGASKLVIRHQDDGVLCGRGCPQPVRSKEAKGMQQREYAGPSPPSLKP